MTRQNRNKHTGPKQHKSRTRTRLQPGYTCTLRHKHIVCCLVRMCRGRYSRNPRHTSHPDDTPQPVGQKNTNDPGRQTAADLETTEAAAHIVIDAFSMPRTVACTGESLAVTTEIPRQTVARVVVAVRHDGAHDALALTKGALVPTIVIVQRVHLEGSGAKTEGCKGHHTKNPRKRTRTTSQAGPVKR